MSGNLEEMCSAITQLFSLVAQLLKKFDDLNNKVMNVLTNQISQEHIGNQRTSENLPESDIMDQTQRDYSDQGACLVEKNTGVSKISQGATMEKTSNNAKLDRKRKKFD